MPDIDKAADVRESPCPRCGGEAACVIPEPEGDVEVFCPNCGPFQMPQDEFDQASPTSRKAKTAARCRDSRHARKASVATSCKVYTSLKPGVRSGTLGDPNAGPVTGHSNSSLGTLRGRRVRSGGFVATVRTQDGVGTQGRLHTRSTSANPAFIARRMERCALSPSLRAVPGHPFLP
jgi:hypothetical protein